MSRDSFCPKISVRSRLTFYAFFYAVLSSLTFFRVRGNAVYTKRTVVRHLKLI